MYAWKKATFTTLSVYMQGHRKSWNHKIQCDRISISHSLSALLRHFFPNWLYGAYAGICVCMSCKYNHKPKNVFANCIWNSIGNWCISHSYDRYYVICKLIDSDPRHRSYIRLGRIVVPSIYIPCFLCHVYHIINDIYFSTDCPV